MGSSTAAAIALAVLRHRYVNNTIHSPKTAATILGVGRPRDECYFTANHFSRIPEKCQ